MSASEVVIVQSPNSTDPETPPAETVAATEAVAEAAVEVAEVNAERDVAIAEIQAEVASDAIAAASVESALQAEVSQCRQNLESLTLQVAQIAEQQLLIRETLTSLEQQQTNPPEVVAESVETPDNQEAREPEPRKKKRLRWI
jgi:hypothetical protein